MSELLLHFAVPFAVFSYFRRPKEAFLLSLVALLPDLDVLIGIHRSWTHSVIVVLAFCGVALLLVRVLRPKLLGLGFLAVLALISHLLLDLFTTYTPLLWPLISQSFFVSFNLGVRMGESMRVYVLPKVLVMPTSFAHFQYLDAPVFTSEGFVVAVILISSALLSRCLKPSKRLFKT
ncbi:metal-dependent hydrolase [Candidatus Bathyarchaeota archaeon]|nr:metal-dependent hydrolase [Candidatus Bathyarchaeota archaeon]